MTTGQPEVWMAISSFGDEAVRRVVPDPSDLHAILSLDEVTAIASHSSVPYWTDGTVLWSIDYHMPGARQITAVEALASFGLVALDEAREKGTWQP